LASYYLKVYVAFSLSLMAANVFRNTIAVWGSYIASKKMHESLLSHVLILPMAFFDSQPLGRLLNRFTKDTEAVDVELLKLVSHEAALLLLKIWLTFDQGWHQIMMVFSKNVSHALDVQCNRAGWSSDSQDSSLLRSISMSSVIANVLRYSSPM